MTRFLHLVSANVVDGNDDDVVSNVRNQYHSTQPSNEVNKVPPEQETC